MGVTPFGQLTYQQLADMRRHLKGFLVLVERAMCEYDLTHPQRSDRTAIERDQLIPK